MTCVRVRAAGHAGRTRAREHTHTHAHSGQKGNVKGGARAPCAGDSFRLWLAIATASQQGANPAMVDRRPSLRGPLHLWHNLPADAVLVLLVGRVWEVEVHRDVYEGLLRAGKRASRQVSMGDMRI